jgi:hypothetical protein
MRTEPEFAEQYTLKERTRFAVAGMLFGALAIAFAKVWLFPWVRGFADSAACRTVFGIEGVRVLWYGLFVGMPAFFAAIVLGTLGWLGYRILRDGQFPPIGEKVFRPTRIRRGMRARTIGWLHVLAFLPFLLIAIWGAYQAEELSRKMPANSAACRARSVPETARPQVAPDREHGA